MRSDLVLLLLALGSATAGCGSRSALSFAERASAPDAAAPPVDASGPVVEPADGGADVSFDPDPDGGSPAACEPTDVVLRYTSGATSEGPFALRATVQVPKSDVYFLVDTTGSMADEIEALRRSFVALVADADCPSDGARCSDDADCPGEACAANGRCAPVATAEHCLADPQIGVARYAGAPESFIHLRDVGPADDATVAAFPPAADGWGQHETMFQAMQCSLSEPGTCPGSCAPDGLRCAGFRPGAVPLIVAVTDEGDQCPYCGADERSVGALARDLGALVIGIDTATGPGDATEQFVRLAEESGSFDADGEPLVFAGGDGDVVDAVRAGLAAAARSPRPVQVELQGGSVDPHSVIDSVRLDRTSAGCFAYGDAVDSDGDGFADRVPRAGHGTTACFLVEPRRRTELAAPATHRLRAILRHGSREADRLDLCVVLEP